MEPVRICLITDENYVKPTAVAISSAILNKNLSSKYEFYIISKNISDLNKELFKKFEGENVKVNIIDFKTQLQETIQHSHVPQTSLIKFGLAEIFGDFNKILYIDGDIIVQKDLGELFALDLGDNYAAVVKDMIGEFSKGLSDIVGVKNYFNSGVMLLNLDLMRKNGAKAKLIKLKSERRKGWTRMDQDELNYFFEGKTILLDPKYNATLGAFREFNYSIDEINNFYNTNYQSMAHLESEAVVNHFAGCAKTRPWCYMDGTYSEIWTYYWLNSPFRHIDLKRGVYSALIYPKIRPILKNIFSITNGKNCKIVTVLGLKFSAKR